MKILRIEKVIIHSAMYHKFGIRSYIAMLSSYSNTLNSIAEIDTNNVVKIIWLLYLLFHL